eukprot:354204-Amphidinium_carterae.1
MQPPSNPSGMEPASKLLLRIAIYGRSDEGIAPDLQAQHVKPLSGKARPDTTVNFLKLNQVLMTKWPFEASPWDAIAHKSLIEVSDQAKGDEAQTNNGVAKIT